MYINEEIILEGLVVIVVESDVIFVSGLILIILKFEKRF